jgi:flagellin-like hook-associated protein FlgL
VTTSDSTDHGPPPSQVEKVKPQSNVEGLKVSIGTVVGALGVIASAALSIGVYLSKQGAVEARIELAERNLGDTKNSVSEQKMTMALLDARVRGVEAARSEDAKKLDRIEANVQAIGDMVLIMCQTTARPGVTCKLSR